MIRITEDEVAVLEEGGDRWKLMPREEQGELMIRYCWQNDDAMPPTSLHRLLMESMLRAADETVEMARAGVVAMRRSGRPPRDFFSEDRRRRSH